MLSCRHLCLALHLFVSKAFSPVDRGGKGQTGTAEAVLKCAEQCETTLQQMLEKEERKSGEERRRVAGSTADMEWFISKRREEASDHEGK